MKKYPLMILLMTPVYMLLKGSISAVSFLEGILFSSLALLATRTVVKPEIKETLPGLLRRIPALMVYILYFSKEALLATFDLIYRCLHPKLPIYPGIVAVDILGIGDLHAAVVSNTLNLTPGTLAIDVDMKRKIIYVHTINAKDLELTKKRIKTVEKYVARVVK
ncbi:MAG: Na+/H+ antiporter subunit E [Candidatus Caldarchaeum sp.]|nr:Na+/H+ antiporter subunit E [Candidatus Caldarchaeum sp.]